MYICMCGAARDRENGLHNDVFLSGIIAAKFTMQNHADSCCLASTFSSPLAHSLTAAR